MLWFQNFALPRQFQICPRVLRKNKSYRKEAGLVFECLWSNKFISGGTIIPVQNNCSSANIRESTSRTHSWLGHHQSNSFQNGLPYGSGGCVMVLNATFKNISVVSWRSLYWWRKTWVPRKNHRPVTSHWQTFIV
jgi:hypothetical protein